MSRIEQMIEEVNMCDETDIMEYNFDPLWKLIREMESVMKTFVDRVEAGTIRSTRTYNQFKEILDAD